MFPVGKIYTMYYCMLGFFLTYNAESYIVNSICLLYINIYFLLLCVECSGVSNEIRDKMVGRNLRGKESEGEKSEGGKK